MHFKEITSVELALQANGKTMAEVLPYNPENSPEGVTLSEKQKWLNGMSLIDEVAQAIKGGKKIDWNDGKRKYFAVFEWNGFGFGFSDSYYGYTHTNALVGSRLSFETEEECDHFGTFIELINEVLINQ